MSWAFVNDEKGFGVTSESGTVIVTSRLGASSFTGYGDYNATPTTNSAHLWQIGETVVLEVRTDWAEGWNHECWISRDGRTFDRVDDAVLDTVAKRLLLVADYAS